MLGVHEEWQYVPSKLNVAGGPSRECLADVHALGSSGRMAQWGPGSSNRDPCETCGTSWGAGGKRTRRSRGWECSFGDAVCTVHSIGVRKHGAYGGLAQTRCSEELSLENGALFGAVEISNEIR